MRASQPRGGSNATDFADSLTQFSTENAVGHPVFSGCGEVIEAVGTHLDVTKRKGAKEEREGLRRRHLALEIERVQEVRIAERTRIARELHDSLLPNLHGMLLQLRAVRNLLPMRPAEAREILRNAIDQVVEAVTEGRKAVQGLRTSAGELNDLAAAIGALGEKLAADPATSQRAFRRVRVEGTARPLHPIIRDAIYRIAEEALRNACQHSQGTQIEVEVRYDKQWFRLRVRDNGKGIDARVLADRGREAHFGLCGMRERAELVGGKLSVWSGRDMGTEIELTIAASRVYATDRTARSNPTPRRLPPVAALLRSRGRGLQRTTIKIRQHKP